MSLTKIGPEHRIQIPQDAVEALRLNVGDVLDGRVDDGKLVFAPAKRQKTSVGKLTAVEQKLLARVKRKIDRIARDPAQTRGLTDEETEVAARAGFIGRDQRWWWTEAWQRGERRAEQEIRRGRTKAFERVDELIQDLRAR